MDGAAPRRSSPLCPAPVYWFTESFMRVVSDFACGQEYSFFAVATISVPRKVDHHFRLVTTRGVAGLYCGLRALMWRLMYNAG
jgi:hypothetical protein